MAKPSDKRPDKKQIDKTIKNVKALCDELKACNNDLKDSLKLAKEFDKQLG